MAEYERLSKMRHEMTKEKFGTCHRHKNGEDFGLHADICADCGQDIRSHPVDLRATIQTLTQERDAAYNQALTDASMKKCELCGLGFPAEVADDGETYWHVDTPYGNPICEASHLRALKR